MSGRGAAPVASMTVTPVMATDCASASHGNSSRVAMAYRLTSLTVSFPR